MPQGPELQRYRITFTYKGRRLGFTVEARNGAKAEAEARRRSKALGMNRVFVNSVQCLDKFVFKSTTNYGAPLEALGGDCPDTNWATGFSGSSTTPGMPLLSLDEINGKIATAWDCLVCFKATPNKPPLIAYELGGRVFLDDGCSGRQELLNRSPFEIVMWLYEWMTYAGYTSNNFEDFIEECWT